MFTDKSSGECEAYNSVGGKVVPSVSQRLQSRCQTVWLGCVPGVAWVPPPGASVSQVLVMICDPRVACLPGVPQIALSTFREPHSPDLLSISVCANWISNYLTWRRIFSQLIRLAALPLMACAPPSRLHETTLVCVTEDLLKGQLADLNTNWLQTVWRTKRC